MAIQNQAVVKFLSDMQSSGREEISAEWATIEQLYNRKLWHQLTLCLNKMVHDPKSGLDGDTLLRCYNDFISDFEHRINPLSLIEILRQIVSHFGDSNEAISFLEKAKETVKSSPLAVILCMTIIGNIQLTKNDLPATKKIVEEAQVLLDEVDGVTSIHGPFYSLSSAYYKLVGNHGAFFRDSLRNLGCIDIETIPEAERQLKAYDLALAAILGKNVYNFGELLSHAILKDLKVEKNQWLVDLLFAFNSGNLKKFENLKQKWSHQPDLKAAESAMLQKIQLLCLMEMTFKRPAHHRQITFVEIANEAHIPVDKVEMLVMKALSLKLVKGSIDQVDEKVHLTWVQPRVLDTDQVAVMKDKLREWCTDVQAMEMLLEDKAQDILV